MVLVVSSVEIVMRNYYYLFLLQIINLTQKVTVIVRNGGFQYLLYYD